MSFQMLDARPNVSGGYKVDVSRGARVGRVSSEWFSRPDDERFLSLSDLQASVRSRAEHSRTRTVESAAIRVEAAREDAETLTLALPGGEAPLAPTHWSFGQLASLVGAPASYLRQLPAPLAAINLQYGLTAHRAEQVKTLETQDGRMELRAVTGPDYGRIYDHELVSAVQKIAGDGVGDTRWKIPGVLDWKTGIYDPTAPVSRETTTLYASDRDVFLFLVDDLNPIEVGKLADGSPDLFFRGFYCWNSEVGAKTLGLASFYLRAVCQNRNLWGVEDFSEIVIRHSKYASDRFAREAAPALTLVAEFGHWLAEKRARVSQKSRLGEKLAYIANHWDGLKLFLEDGRIEMDSNAVENRIRPIALTRKNALFAGHDEGARSWARLASLIETARVNAVDPFACIKATLEALAAGCKTSQLDELTPWAFAARQSAEQRACS